MRGPISARGLFKKRGNADRNGAVWRVMGSNKCAVEASEAEADCTMASLSNLVVQCGLSSLPRQTSYSATFLDTGRLFSLAVGALRQSPADSNRHFWKLWQHTQTRLVSDEGINGQSAAWSIFELRLFRVCVCVCGSASLRAWRTEGRLPMQVHHLTGGKPCPTGSHFVASAARLSFSCYKRRAESSCNKINSPVQLGCNRFGGTFSHTHTFSNTLPWSPEKKQGAIFLCAHITMARLCNSPAW